MFKDILVPLVLGTMHEAAVRQACALATTHGAHVTALVSVSLAMPIAAAWTYYPVGVYETLDEAARATTAELAHAVQQGFAHESVPLEVRQAMTFWLTPVEVATLHARHADLTVLGVDATLGQAQQRLLGGLLEGAGRPVLLVRETAGTPSAFDHIVIAWKASREANRAVHDALPLLQRARRVDVLLVDRDPDHHTEVDETTGHLATHLARHGVPVEIVRRVRGTSTTGEAIIDYACERGADLIVAGGYSRPRALEQVLGGVTRTLLERAPIPVLLSH